MSGHDDSHGDGHGKARSRSHGHGHGGGGHAEGEHEGAPEWLISFADMVMLMMGFFVIMFALNVQPKGGNAGGGGEQSEGVANEPDMIDFAIAVRKAFHNDVDLSSSDPRDQPLIQRIMERQQGAGESRDDGTKGQDRNVRSVRPANFYGKGTAVNFALRSTSLDEEAGRTLQELASKNRGRKNVLEIRGHASASEAFRKPEEAMAIGFDRAMAVARGLAAGGIEWWRMRVVASGDHERVEAFPADAEGDSRNARAEIFVTDEIADPREPTGPAGAATPAPGGAQPSADAAAADPVPQSGE